MITKNGQGLGAVAPANSPFPGERGLGIGIENLLYFL